MHRYFLKIFQNYLLNLGHLQNDVYINSIFGNHSKNILIIPNVNVLNMMKIMNFLHDLASGGVYDI